MWWGEHGHKVYSTTWTNYNKIWKLLCGQRILLNQQRNISEYFLQVMSRVKFVRARKEASQVARSRAGSIQIRCAPGDPWISNNKKLYINIIVVRFIVPKIRNASDRWLTGCWPDWHWVGLAVRTATSVDEKYKVIYGFAFFLFTTASSETNEINIHLSLQNGGEKKTNK